MIRLILSSVPFAKAQIRVPTPLRVSVWGLGLTVETLKKITKLGTTLIHCQYFRSVLRVFTLGLIVSVWASPLQAQATELSPDSLARLQLQQSRRSGG